MIRLHPVPDADYYCPHCLVPLEVKGWYIPGMRNLADLRCPACGYAFYGDLPAGHGLYYPTLIEKNTGTIYDEHGVGWFTTWLKTSYDNRIDSPVGFFTEENRPLNRPLLLNCLDTLYGHCVLKLLNAQYYLDHYPDLDLVVLIPQFLRWMVPEGVAAIWTVDLSLKRGIEWNDWLAAELKCRLESFEVCWLSVAFSHPNPEDFDIHQFTKVRPFPSKEWIATLDQPKVTFIWREDRTWCDQDKLKILYGLPKRMKIKLLRLNLSRIRIEEQNERLVTFAEALRRDFHRLDFAVAGLGHSGGLCDWITDLRTMEISESVERDWCVRYAKSHIVIGVHGSNMLLPSAHAGAVVELVPADRWINLVQDILTPAEDLRELLIRSRFLPLESSASIAANVTASLLRTLPSALVNFGRPWNDHVMVQTDPFMVAKRRREIARKLQTL